MAWNLNSDRPIYAQILEVMQQRIIAGRYGPGEKVPSVRELAAEAGVNPNTMQKALSELEREGLVVTLRTSGRVVTSDVDVIDRTRSQLALEQVHSFISKMKELGMDKEEITGLLKWAEEESRKENEDIDE